MTIIVKNDAKETLRAEVLTQDNLSESWKESLKKNRSENMEHTTLKDLKNRGPI